MMRYETATRLSLTTMVFLIAYGLKHRELKI